MTTHHLNAFLCAALLLTGAVSAQSTTPPAVQSGSQSATIVENFEMLSIGYGGAVGLGITVLDENAIALGQGPGLVLDGCVYSSATQLQWNDAGWYGTTSKNILSYDNTMTLTYDQPVSSVAFELSAFLGFADSAVIRVYDAGGSLIHTSSAIAVPGPAAVAWSYQAGSIGQVTVQSQIQSWSTLIDKHEFGSAGPRLTRTGSCPGSSTFTVNGATPGGTLAIAMSGSLGSFSIPGAYQCAGTVLGLGGIPTLVGTLTANANGVANRSVNLPVAVCGRYLQMVDLASCTTTNVIQM
jgi:hypothetical protein